ncbi:MULTISPECIES: microcin C ABC transporter permease YejB [Paracoccus]|jgi:microcin C transport system permease protein|uniref:Binding-protein-dependent transport systems inner membrane component n=1 Tax=Paracoccus denitrificans (strain Pd 1222) TaxID=318586 RepID=A1B309_PARDP|nr:MULTISPECIES: microcin C ABC transporter permease YejB [Paracoccus]ABL69903.1 binding-protein-dependent transport systems inner membrane component [Paracoccus denitrificans PD1222]MBB4626983.1 microcin C transport system permease protein [Paracoccus denitrificans]MCU7428369.1 microcin C ABC transporter permease YejB [Paracoccus denitrificans]MDK8871536.1 microcin C ABC transporter permease YejB [Paracoccus sp. SSJ]QAR25292.1 microcin C ABC transporter permease YejB [Paracoccus denitrificans
MAAYILRRLLLIIPTLIGIMLVNFTLTQFVPGGPIEQVIARVQGEGDALRNITGGAGDAPQNTEYAGARGIPPELLDQLEVQMGFAKIVCTPAHQGEPDLKSPDCAKEKIGAAERFLIMLGNYVRFDFGISFFRSISVIDLVLEKMPVSITLGLWSTLIAYLISIPLGIRKAVRNGTSFDTWTSGAIIVGYAIPAFLFAVLLMVLFAGGSYWQIFPLRGLTSDNWSDLSLWGKVKDYLWHIALPVTATTISSFATLTLLTKNSFLDEINKQYVMTARAKGLTEGRVLYGHVFRNAMLIVIAGFPSMFLGVFFGSSILIETIFSLDGLGRLGFEAAVQRDYPVIFGTLYVFGLMGLVVGILSDLMYVLVDPRIDFERRAG